MIEKTPMVMQTPELKKKPGRKCQVCELCEQFKDIDDLVHKRKFTEVMPVGAVLKEMIDITGKKVSQYSLTNHYSKHLSAALQLEYKNQAQQLSNRGLAARDSNKKPKTSKKFDSIEHLKGMYTDLSSRLVQFETKHGKYITSDSLRIYKDIVEQLRKLAQDIAKVETDRAYIGKIIIEVNQEVTSNIVMQLGDVVRASLLELTEDEGTRRVILENVKNGTNKILEKSMAKLDTELSKRL